MGTGSDRTSLRCNRTFCQQVGGRRSRFRFFKMSDQRSLLKKMIALPSGIGCSSFFSDEASGKTALALREAMFYRNMNGQNVQCLLCPRECVISDGKRGFCRNRENQKGTLYTLVYGRPAVVDIGPIEKAPIYHFIPGHSRSTSKGLAKNSIRKSARPL